MLNSPRQRLKSRKLEAESRNMPGGSFLLFSCPLDPGRHAGTISSRIAAISLAVDLMLAVSQ
jgi:hypothetical protein